MDNTHWAGCHTVHPECEPHAESVRRYADDGTYARRVEDIVEKAHLNANEALVARLLADVADWFADTYDSDLFAETLWEFVMDFAIPGTAIANG